MNIVAYKIDPVLVVQKVYELSVPQGLGSLHFEPGPLNEEDAISCISLYPRKQLTAQDDRMNIEKGMIAIDYLKGRACKFSAKILEGKVYVPMSSWYDHSEQDLKNLKEFLENNAEAVYKENVSEVTTKTQNIK